MPQASAGAVNEAYDADINLAVDAAVFGSFFHQGQTASPSTATSSDLGRAKAVADRIEVGITHVNDHPINDEPHIPFGGVKGSGLGRYNGEAIMREFTEERWVSLQHDRREYPL